MLPKYHILFGLVFSSILFFVFPQIGLIGAGIIFLSSFLIDVDHYVYYVLDKKLLNPKKAIRWFKEKRKNNQSLSKKEKKDKPVIICFLHGLEVLMILFILGIFVHQYFLFIFLGFLFHLILDFFEQLYYHSRNDKLSLIADFIKLKRFNRKCLTEKKNLSQRKKRI